MLHHDVSSGNVRHRNRLEIHILCIRIRDQPDIDWEFPLSSSAVVSREFVQELAPGTRF
jgi:hypothetical protein